MDLNRETVTLIAACIAALTSIISIFVSLYSNRAAEFRVAHRKTLEPVIYDLSEATYAIIAICVKMSKSKSKERTNEYLELANQSRDNLEKSRRKIRYVLYGLDEALQLISGSPVYFTHLQNESEDLSAYIYSVTKLRSRVDEIIRCSYAKGRPPTRKEILQISKAVSHSKLLFDKSSSRANKSRKSCGINAVVS